MSFKIEFGKETKRQLFHLDSATFFTNHGSFGAVPKAILEKKFKLQLELETSPDKWFRNTNYKEWDKNIKYLADYLNVDTEKILICENATDAINSVLKSVEFNEENDAILVTEYTYQAVLNAVDYTAKYRRGKNNKIMVFKVQCKFPINSVDELLAEFEKTCNDIALKKIRLRLAVIDHISSATAMLYPIKEIIKIIRNRSKISEYSEDTLIMIDGAHCLGQVDIDLNNYDCDYYISNLHKWFLAPKSCSFLYLKNEKKLSVNLQPNFISHGYESSVSINFLQRATSDKSSWFVIDECINFYENYFGGLKKITEYNSSLLERAVKLLLKEWETELIKMPTELEAPFMKLIKLPYLKRYIVDKPENAQNVTFQLCIDLFDKYNVFAMCFYIQNEMYCRISCFVYNTIDDFIALKDAILDLKSK